MFNKNKRKRKFSSPKMKINLSITNGLRFEKETMWNLPTYRIGQHFSNKRSEEYSKSAYNVKVRCYLNVVYG